MVQEGGRTGTEQRGYLRNATCLQKMLLQPKTLLTFACRNKILRIRFILQTTGTKKFLVYLLLITVVSCVQQYWSTGNSVEAIKADGFHKLVLKVFSIFHLQHLKRYWCEGRELSLDWYTSLIIDLITLLRPGRHCMIWHSKARHQNTYPSFL